MEDAHRLVYTSERVEGLRTDAIIERIVLPSIRRNRSMELTGCIWFGDSRFVQVLEGAEERVAGLFDQIERDKRHRNIRLVSSGAASERWYDRYSMRYLVDDGVEAVERLVRGFATPNGATANGDGTIQCEIEREEPSMAVQIVQGAIARLRGR